MVESSIKTEEIDYGDEPKLKGFIAHPSDTKKKVPGVLIVHEWWGLDDYCRSRAKQLAGMGYCAMALDMYGGGKQTCHPKEAGAFMKESIKSFESACNRFHKALDILKNHSACDGSKIAAIGYCYGGMIVLNMAKKGYDLKGVASFHGSLTSHVKAKKGVCKAKVLVCNGKDDKMVPKESIAEFKREFDEAGIQYKFINYPGAIHGFTNPAATARGKEYGIAIAYNEAADKASWGELSNFLKEVFA